MSCLIVKESGEQGRIGNSVQYVFQNKMSLFLFGVVAFNNTLHVIQFVVEGACWVISLSSCRAPMVYIG